MRVREACLPLARGARTGILILTHSASDRVEDPKRIHLIAVCGTGMGSLAGMLKKAGHHVTGSDQNIYPPMSTLLAELGIPCGREYDPVNIPSEVDLVVIGNAVSRSNIEVQEVLRRGIPYCSMPEALARFFLEDRRSVVVAGTHGKTTTASLLAWILEAGGLDPGFMIGGWVKNFGGNHKIGKGLPFVVEGDEYDTAFFDKGPKFLHYRPHTAILTSVEFDHGDIFKDLAAVKAAFRSFVELIPKDGLLVSELEEPNVAEVSYPSACPMESYGLHPGVFWRAEALEAGDHGMSFEVFRGKTRVGRFDIPLSGIHNVKNATAVIAVALHHGLPVERIREGLAAFEGIKRRQEIVGRKGDVLVMDDFAHHPTAIDVTLRGLKGRYPGRRLWAIFEPRSATSRRNVFQSAFAASFGAADRVIIADPFAPEKIPADLRLDPERLVRDIRASGKIARHIGTADAIVRTIIPEVGPHDLIVVMSSGGFDGIHQKLLSGLSGR